MLRINQQQQKIINMAKHLIISLEGKRFYDSLEKIGKDFSNFFCKNKNF